MTTHTANLQPRISAAACCAAILAAINMGPAARGDEPPSSWVDPDTGHRIIPLTREPGSGSLYFNQNGYTSDGKRLVTASEGLA